MKIAHEVSLDEAKRRAKRNELLRYGANTCWWGMDDAPWYSTGPSEMQIGGRTVKSDGLPCDPRGGMLLQTEKSLDFIASAEENAEHYGKYGVRTFLLALHGCVITDDGRPTCFESWKEYEALIDALPKESPCQSKS